MNKVFLSGNLTRDPESKVVGTTTVVNFTVASNRRFKKKDGTFGEETDFFSCEAWDSGAERIAANFTKGSKILIEGSLKEDSWEQDGQKRSRVKIRVDRFENLSPRKSERPVDEQPVGVGADAEGGDGEGGDIPF